jgi:excisionase family DNA binding protein
MVTTLTATAEPMLTIDEVAEHLKCCRSTAKTLIYSNAIKSRKIGRLRRVRLSDLNAYIEGLPAEPASA